MKFCSFDASENCLTLPFQPSRLQSSFHCSIRWIWDVCYYENIFRFVFFFFFNNQNGSQTFSVKTFQCQFLPNHLTSGDEIECLTLNHDKIVLLWHPNMAMMPSCVGKTPSNVSWSCFATLDQIPSEASMGWGNKYSKIPKLRPPLGLSKSGLKDHFWTVPKVVFNQRYTGCRKWRKE